MNKAIILLSAGLDSTVSLAMAKEQGADIQLALTFDYGQKSAKKELEQSQKIAQHYQVPWENIHLPWLAKITNTALSKTSEMALPEVDISELDQVTSVTLKSAKSVWVPNRNGVFINIAGAYADRYGYDTILVGFNAEEAVTFPDNTPQYAETVTQSLAFSTQTQTQVKSAILNLNKVEIIQEALKLKVPLELIWSCYKEGNTHCGQCESCNRLKRGLENNGASDILNLLFGEI